VAITGGEHLERLGDRAVEVGLREALGHRREHGDVGDAEVQCPAQASFVRHQDRAPHALKGTFRAFNVSKGTFRASRPSS
jgi:hypothetical protein